MVGELNRRGFYSRKIPASPPPAPEFRCFYLVCEAECVLSVDSVSWMTLCAAFVKIFWVESALSGGLFHLVRVDNGLAS